MVSLILLFCFCSVAAFGNGAEPSNEEQCYTESEPEGATDYDEPSVELLEFLGEWEVPGKEWIDPVQLDTIMESDNDGDDYDAEK